jgi:tRNA threonylcarbamoyl adenosine modification protein (Sua5/YciO/YrdC/YwlC family)
VSDPIREAASAALEGALVIIPTDTVYGLATRCDDPSATARLFSAKGRSRDLELPVLVTSASAAREIAVFDADSDALAARFWPGPLTLVLPRTPRGGGWDLGGDGSTIGVRVPHHPLALAVLALTGPLAVTSANRSGEPTPTCCDELVRVFGDAVAVYVCQEEPLGGTSSTVVETTRGTARVLRSGAVSEDRIRAVLASPRGSV